jgi:hypothetical protein
VRVNPDERKQTKTIAPGRKAWATARRKDGDMKDTTKNSSSPLTERILAAVCAAALLFANAGSAGEPVKAATGVLPPQSMPHGKPLGEWSGAWVQWAFSIPADQNPVLDTTGEFGAVGQSGPVWFLAGTFGGPAERTVTIPAGKALFFPLAEGGWVNTPQFGDPEWSPEQEAFARSVIGASIDGVVGLSCQIDGQEVANLEDYRFQTPPDATYMITQPENSIWLPPGIYGPSVDDGYWLMLAPLSVGQHTIHFTAAQADGSWATDVTYHLTVADHSE